MCGSQGLCVLALMDRIKELPDGGSGLLAAIGYPYRARRGGGRVDRGAAANRGQEAAPTVRQFPYQMCSQENT